MSPLEGVRGPGGQLFADDDAPIVPLLATSAEGQQHLRSLRGMSTAAGRPLQIDEGTIFHLMARGWDEAERRLRRATWLEHVLENPLCQGVQTDVQGKQQARVLW